MSEIFVVAVCLIVNGLLAAIEMAFVTVTRVRLRDLAQKGSTAAKEILELRESPERTLSVLQIGITGVGAIAAAVGGGGAVQSISPWLLGQTNLSETAAQVISIVFVVVPITFLSVVVGELVPKTFALRSPTPIVLAAAKPLRILDTLMSPLVTVFEKATHLLLRLLPGPSKSDLQKDQSVATLDMLNVSSSTKQYVINLVEVERKFVRHIYLPWSRVDFVKHSDDVASVVKVVISSGHTRLPVVDGESVVGIINTKEIIAFREQGNTDWTQLIRPTITISDHFSLLKTLRIMQSRKSHLGVVHSLDSKLLGIVTLEDIVEEIFGDIFDEDDDGLLKKVLANSAKLKNRTRGL
ncbi:MAG: HlyC/CorC family transporter [Bdellovibrionales bacterium CG10_big_fil_rev_8_21_14_0_10_45_34]|nr:MAG: HlyC/CorC family transporter [Bdellovibrionales bacterium CG10_big_fil_rev_8_21_14_0_10_45_34]